MDYKKLIKISDAQSPYIPEIFTASTEHLIPGASYEITIYSNRWDTRSYFYCDSNGNLVLNNSNSDFSNESDNKKARQVSKIFYDPAIKSKFQALARAGFPDNVYGIVCDPASQWQSVPVDIIKYPYQFDGKGYRYV